MGFLSLVDPAFLVLLPRYVPAALLWAGLCLVLVAPTARGAAGPAPSEAAASSESAVVRNQPAAASEELPEFAARNPNALQRFWSWSDARVRGVVDYILPDTQDKRTWRFSLQPKLGDFVKHDHVRLPMSLSYGFTERFEGEFGFDPYFVNSFKDDGDGAGAANLRGSLKYQWKPALDAEVRAASGVRVVHPLSSAPYEFNDGVNRYSFYQTFARPSPWNPRMEGFLNLSYDLITPSAADGGINEDDPQNDFYKIGTGVLWRRPGVTYGLAFGYAHTVNGVGTSFTTVTPSVIFDVPSRYMFNSPGRWQLGASVEVKRYGDETAFDFRVRVRWQVDFRRMVRDWRAARAKERMQLQADSR